MKVLNRFAFLATALLFLAGTSDIALAQAIGATTSTATQIGGQTADHVAFTGGTIAGTTLTTPTLSGGTINNTVIGGTTAVAGSFTTLTASTSTTSAAYLGSGTAPTPSGTGTPSIATGSTDTAGEVTAGSSATSVVITFATAKTNAPFCVVTDQSQITSFAYSISTTAITITQTATSGNKIDYFCVQH